MRDTQNSSESQYTYLGLFTSCVNSLEDAVSEKGVTKAEAAIHSFNERREVMMLLLGLADCLAREEPEFRRWERNRRESLVGVSAHGAADSELHELGHPIKSFKPLSLTSSSSDHEILQEENFSTDLLQVLFSGLEDGERLFRVLPIDQTTECLQKCRPSFDTKEQVLALVNSNSHALESLISMSAEERKSHFERATRVLREASGIFGGLTAE